MAHEIRNRVVRPATAEEKARHQMIREQIEQELPELRQWALDAAQRHKDKVPVGTVLTAEEAHVLKAMDDYATKHALNNRAAVVREALANLLGVQLSR